MPDKKLTFPIPDGLDLEGKEEGDALEVVAELRLEKDGKLCLKKVNGIEIAGYKEKEPERDFAASTPSDYPEE